MSRDTIRRTAVGLEIIDRPGEHWWWYCAAYPAPNDHVYKHCSKAMTLSDQEFCALGKRPTWIPGYKIPCGWFYDETIV